MPACAREAAAGAGLAARVAELFAGVGHPVAAQDAADLLAEHERADALQVAARLADDVRDGLRVERSILGLYRYRLAEDPPEQESEADRPWPPSEVDVDKLRTPWRLAAMGGEHEDAAGTLMPRSLASGTLYLTGEPAVEPANLRAAARVILGRDVERVEVIRPARREDPKTEAALAAMCS